MNLEDLGALGLDPKEVRSLENPASKGPHPDPGRILASLAGDCDADETEAIRDHLALCTRCADLALVLGAEDGDPVGERAFEAMVEEVLEDRPRASDWRVIEERIQTPSAAAPARPARPTPSRWWPALAAALLLVTAGSWLRTYQLQQTLEGVSDFRLGAQTLHLSPREDPLLSAEGRGTVSQDVGEGDLAIYLYLPTEAPVGPYRVELRPRDSEDAATLWSASGLGSRGEDRFVFLTVGRHTLDPGTYRLELSTVSAEEPFASYDLQVEGRRP